MYFDFIVLSVEDFFEARFGFLSNTGQMIGDDETCLDEAVAWLLRSIEKTGGNGSSMGYAFLSGWRSAYPETTGYIVCTLLKLADIKDISFLEIARKQGDWLLSIQTENGGIVGGALGAMKEPIVFNTGQVLHGLNSLYKITGELKYLEGGLKAGEFLVSCMDESGCFVRHLHNNIVHAYNSRTAWALMELGRLAGRKDLEEVAHRNIRWTLSQQQKNGFFLHNNFAAGRPALTHSIGYVLRGILESYLLSGEKDYLDAIYRTAERLIRKYGVDRRLVAEIGSDWEDLSSHLCLTGYAQLAIIFLKLFRINKDPRYLNLALHLVDDLKKHQYLGNASPDFRGAVKGSFPIYGRYAPLQFPNWATKFFIDALLLKMEVMKEYEDRLLG